MSVPPPARAPPASLSTVTARARPHGTSVARIAHTKAPSPERVAADAIETGLAFLCFFRSEGRQRKPADLSMAQFRCLAMLGKAPARPMAEMADDLGVSPPALTKMVDGLVERDLVARTPDADDRRRIDVRLTAAGTRLVASFRTGLETSLAARLATLDAAELAALARTLPTLRACLASSTEVC